MDSFSNLNGSGRCSWNDPTRLITWHLTHPRLPPPNVRVRLKEPSSLRFLSRRWFDTSAGQWGRRPASPTLPRRWSRAVYSRRGLSSSSRSFVCCPWSDRLLHPLPPPPGACSFCCFLSYISRQEIIFFWFEMNSCFCLFGSEVAGGNLPFKTNEKERNYDSCVYCYKFGIVPPKEDRSETF